MQADALLEMHGEAAGLSSGAKMGCVALAVGFVLLFIALLFVLPKFLYGEKEGDAPAPVESGANEPPRAVPFSSPVPVPSSPSATPSESPGAR